MEASAEVGECWELKEERVEMFRELVEMGKKVKRVNQYM